MPATDPRPAADDDLNLLIDAARAAAAVALSHAAPQVWHKPGDAGPVTEADLEVDALLHRTLLSARPGYGWLSEETADTPDRLAADRVFIIDPIDGTRAFIAGSADWAHSLALAEHGEITAAVVLLPARDQLYAAARGRGATLNGAPIRAATGTGFDGATLLGPAASLDPAHWADGAVPPLRRTFRSSLAFRLCLLAEGRYDAMLTLRPTWEWDIAAGSLILAEAGGTATDRRGAALRFNRPHPQCDGVLAAGALHGALLQRLAPGPKAQPDARA